MDNLKIISSLKWYFEVKNLCLEKALALRCPLSVKDQKELRLYYSQYFSGLTAAVDLLKDDGNFYSNLKEKMSFEDHADGKQNYHYVRELRNSIIHRGEDITSGSHVIDGWFPLIVIPQRVTNKDGKKNYESFDYYLINLISKCESTIPKAIHEHLKEKGLLKVSKSQEEMEIENKKFINDSNIMPDWVKHLSQGVIPDFIDIQETLINNLTVELERNVVDEFRKNLVGDFIIWSP